ncbi:MAG: ABC transporter permease subunit [Candidatus Xenobium sp.]|jgi:ABC-type transport system involved in multi-copper enzyme maturation permease subunit|nr:hypothetical protein [Burkholderiales bacterium]
MRSFLENPLLGRASVSWPGNSRQVLLAALLWGGLLIIPWSLGVCACTVFEIGAFLLVLLAALRGGNTLYGAITGEREKKTLDGLRLTQLTAGQVVMGKVSGEIFSLCRLVLSALPALLVLTVVGGIPLQALAGTMALTLAAGLFASASGLLVSSLAGTTSQAVLSGWLFKGLWLVFSPFGDLLLRAVLVRSEPPIFFTAANPLVALALVTVPEAGFGMHLWLVPVNLVFLILGGVGMLGLAARRLAAEAPNTSEVQQGAVHGAWRKAWAPSWVQDLLPAFSGNAAFLREVAWQARTGAGTWPGLVIWLVLFLAPFLYARAWSVQHSESLLPTTSPRVEVRLRAPLGVPPPPPPRAVEQTGARVVYATAPGHHTTLLIRGHRPETCFRLALYQCFGVPMPWGAVQALEPVGPPRGTVREVRNCPLEQVDPRTLGDLAMAPPPPPDFQQGTGSVPPHRHERLARPLQVGFLGTVLLFLLSLSVRSSALLAGALTGERDRRNWQDLALTGITARQVVFGKLLGGLFHPLLQMTLAFPVLLIYVYAEALSLLGLGSLYLFSVALALTSGLLGLWSSARARSTHASHGMAITCLLLAFVAGLVTGTFDPGFILAGVALVVGLEALLRRVPSWKGWLLMSMGLVVTPQALSPLAAVAAFIPTLGQIIGLRGIQETLPETVGFLGTMLFLAGTSLVLLHGILERIEDPGRGGALRVQED